MTSIAVIVIDQEMVVHTHQTVRIAGWSKPRILCLLSTAEVTQAALQLTREVCMTDGDCRPCAKRLAWAEQKGFEVTEKEVGMFANVTLSTAALPQLSPGPEEWVATCLLEAATAFGLDMEVVEA